MPSVSLSKPYKYRTIAVGGTFDIIHKGHEQLLRRAFESGERVVIGLTSDDYVTSSGKKVNHDFRDRAEHIKSYLKTNFPGRNYEVTELERTFGPGMYTSQVDAIAVSEETAPRVEEANKKRRELGLPDLKVEIVPMVLAKDGEKLSSTRIREGKIDEVGNRR